MKSSKYIIFLLIAISFLDFIKNNNSSFKTLASDNTGVEINFGDSIGVNQNIQNLKNRKEIYEKEIIEKVKRGGAIEAKMGKPIFGLKSFFNENYCTDIGEYSIIGAVSYPTWCDRDSGPFSNVKNPNSVIIIPLTLELKSGFKENLVDTLTDGLQADYIGVIKGYNHKPEKLTGPDFKFGQDQLLGIINHSKKLMLLYQINDAGIYQKNQLNKFIKGSSYDLAIDLINIGLTLNSPISKNFLDLCVDAPQYLSTGTLIPPMLSYSFLVFIIIKGIKMLYIKKIKNPSS